MSTTDHSHLDGARIQALLDARLPEGERAAVESHVATCARCRARVQEWEALFARLASLPALAPSDRFAERVMAEVTVRTPVLVRIREWLGLGARRPAATGHLDRELALEYLDASLPGRARERVGAHLASCDRCRNEVAEWRTVLRNLESLERVTPSPGFADRVMARVAVPEPEAARPTVSIGERIAGWARSLGPRTRRGWTVAVGAAGAPVAALSVALYALFSHPQLTPTSLAAFLWWQVTGLTSGLATGVANVVTESALVFRLWSVLQNLGGSPLTLGAGAAAFSVATLGAAWILYRNLIATPTVDRPYANANV